MLPVIDLAPRGEGGMVASVEEAESSASSTSSGCHSADLPIVGPPRGLLARASRRKVLFRFLMPAFYSSRGTIHGQVFRATCPALPAANPMAALDVVRE